MTASAIFFAAVAGSAIDTAAGILRGVSIITKGYAEGHVHWDDSGIYPVHIDDTTLNQVATALGALDGEGLKVRVEHWSGFSGIIGTVDNPRLDGDRVRGDITLFSNETDKALREKVLEVAAAIPSQVGLSIEFDQLDPEIRDGIAYARVEKLTGVAFVDRPAANPDGLFSAGNSLEVLQKMTEQLSSIKAENITLSADLASTTAALESSRSQLAAVTTERDNATARVEQLQTLLTAAKALAGLAPARVVPVVTPTAAPQESPVEQWKQAMESGNKALADKLFAQHKDAIWAARANHSN